MESTPAGFAQAREQFLAMVGDLRPQLHRYCARLTGSVIDGEDIVQDALAKAFYAMTMMPEVPPLRPWLFRIAHNAAILKDVLGHSAEEAAETMGATVPAVKAALVRGRARLRASETAPAALD